MGSRFQRSSSERGATAVQLLVILVPVVFAFMGFAIDLGRLWMIRGEVNQAATAVAIAAAGRVTGGAALDQMYAAATQALNAATGNKYNYGLTPIVFDPSMLACFTSVTAAAANDLSAAADCGSAGAVAVQAQITVPAPLLFWSFLPAGLSRTTDVASYAVAGMSAPLCTACGIEPFAVAALDAADTVDFGFGDPAIGTIFTLAFHCTGNQNPPAALTGATGGVLRYVIVNRTDTSSALDDAHQLFRAAAGGLPTPTDTATPNPTGSIVPMACMAVNDAAEGIWNTAVPAACNLNAPLPVSYALCGLDTRFEDATTLSACSELGDIAPLFPPDTSPDSGTDGVVSYAGNGRRVITVAVVDNLATAPTGTMTVLGFRQFLLLPNADGGFINAGDADGRFNAMYIGTVKPAPQGWFDDRFGLACPIGAFSGPGKVVVHQ